MMSLIPMPYRILAIAALVVASVAFGWVRGAGHVQAEWAAADAVRLETNQKALLTRVASNAALAKTQAATNAAITKGKDDEITRLTARVEHLHRLRAGTAICSGSAATSEASSAGSGDGTDSSSRLVRDDADRDLRALIVAVETDLATGRACQSFIRDNGLLP